MPSPGSFVIDACSAPGGKTTHLAQLMENRGFILALEIHTHKLSLIRRTASVLALILWNAGEGGMPGNLPEELSGLADFVLVDAPCSGLGVLRRRPDARWRIKPEDLPAIVKLQAEILESASCVKDGGVLVYSTCTLLREENMGQEWRTFLPATRNLSWRTSVHSARSP